MRWWCSAQATAWSWTWQPYLGVWLFVALLVGLYSFAWRRFERRARTGAPWGPRARAASWAGAVLGLWLALDWPIGALGAGYLASAHMVQFLLLALGAPPLLLYGAPPAAYGALTRRRRVLGALRVVTHPLVALVSFNVIVVATHWPPVVDGLMTSQIGSFVLDMAWLAAGLLLWWPIVAPVPRRPAFGYLYKIGYLILATILNTPVFVLLTFSDLPLYRIFELAPPVHGIPTRVDQQIAGLLMKMGGGFIYWIGITVLFVRWYRREGAEDALRLPNVGGSADGRHN